MRYDVLSEISGILKARYLINERVIFHPTKCAAGAMLGTAVQLLGLRDLPAWMQVLGDQEFLRALILMSGWLEEAAVRLSTQSTRRPRPWAEVVRDAWSADKRIASVLEQAISSILPPTANPPSMDDIQLLLTRARSTRNVAWRLTSRRFPKLAYRLRVAHHTGGASDVTIAEDFSDPKRRYALERSIEEICHLPMGSIFVHCPRRKTSMKVAEVLVVGADLPRAAQLRDLTKVSPEGLVPYENEIRAVEQMYLSIWQFHAYVDVAFWAKQPIVEWAFERKLGFPNDRLLSEELRQEKAGTYHVLAGPLRDEVAFRFLPDLLERVDAEIPARARLGEDKADVEAWLRRLNREVMGGIEPVKDRQRGLPGLGDK